MTVHTTTLIHQEATLHTCWINNYRRQRKLSRTKNSYCKTVQRNKIVFDVQARLTKVISKQQWRHPIFSLLLSNKTVEAACCSSKTEIMRCQVSLQEEDGSRTRKFFQQGKGACSPASLLLQQLAGYSDHHAVGKWGLEAMACELAEHLVDCQAVVLPHMVQQAQSMILCRECQKPIVGSFPFCPLCCPEVPGWAPATCSMPSCCWLFP